MTYFSRTKLDKQRQALIPPTDVLSKADSLTLVSAKRRSWCLPWGFLYISGIGASHNCQDLTFCGTGPMSEPETKVVSSFIESRKENIACFLTMRSYGQLILMPYGYTKNKSSNHEEPVRPLSQSLEKPQHDPAFLSWFPFLGFWLQPRFCSLCFSLFPFSCFSHLARRLLGRLQVKCCFTCIN